MPLEAYFISDVHIDHYIRNPNKYSNDSVGRVLEKHLLPADVLVLAGDLADNVEGAVAVLEYLNTLYGRVLWVEGNHDWVCKMGSFPSSRQKVAEIVHRALVLEHCRHLSGSVEDVSGTLFGGSMGQCDFGYAKKHFGHSYEQMAHIWREDWFDGNYWALPGESHESVLSDQMNRLEKSLEAGADVMVSHFGPADTFVQPKFHNLYTGFFYFDGASVTGNAGRRPKVWAFGHTHDQLKWEDKEGTLYVCNPLGYPGERRMTMPKEDFRLCLA